MHLCSVPLHLSVVSKHYKGRYIFRTNKYFAHFFCDFFWGGAQERTKKPARCGLHNSGNVLINSVITAVRVTPRDFANFPKRLYKTSSSLNTTVFRGYFARGRPAPIRRPPLLPLQYSKFSKKSECSNTFSLAMSPSSSNSTRAISK